MPEFFISEAAQQWAVIIVMALVVFSLFKEILKPALTFFAAGIFLMVLGIIQPLEFLAALSNQQIITVIILVLITSALNKNFNVTAFFDKIFAKAKTPKGFLWRMMGFVALLSSCLNNTPVVAVMTPYVYNWAKKFGAHPSKLLIPLSFSTILGGMLTIIGTSTNLVLNGFLNQANQPLLTFADFFFLGAIVTIFGTVYLYTIGYKLLPENKEAFDDVKAKAPEYLIETEVETNKKLDGLAVKDSGLQSVRGAYLIELHRDGQVISPVSPSEVLQASDKLLFMGKSENILELVSSGIGLKIPKHDENLEVVEAILPANSSLSGKTISDTDFKKKYDAELLAIHRNGEKLTGKVEDTPLTPGDLLLLSVSNVFFHNEYASKDLYVLSKVESHDPPNPMKLKLMVAGALLFLGASIIGWLSIFQAALFILSLFLLLSLYSFRDINRDIDLDLVVLLICALTLGNTLISTGAAELLSTSFIDLLYPFGEIGILLGLFLLTISLTSFVTNVAAVSIAFPVAYSVSQTLGVAGTPFYLGIAFAASAAFLTPVGYQTNWMVFGPGSYTPKDFFRVGFPLALGYTIICILFLSFRFELY